MLAVQCKMARVALGLGLRELAELAKVAPATISRLEAGEELKPRTVDAIRASLESAGVEFIAENGGGAGVRLKKGARLRQSAPEGDPAAFLQVEDLNSENDE